MKPLLLSKSKISDNRVMEHFTSEQADYLFAFSQEEVKRLIDVLDNKPAIIHYLARGYNLHNVFVDLLKKTGPAKVHIVSYSITELPMRILSQLLKKEVITELNIVLDFTVKRTPALDQFVKQFSTTLKYTDTHAKISIIENDNFNLVLSGSANLTKNNRYENGFIFSGKVYTQAYTQWFKKIFDEAK